MTGLGSDEKGVEIRSYTQRFTGRPVLNQDIGDHSDSSVALV